MTERNNLIEFIGDQIKHLPENKLKEIVAIVEDHYDRKRYMDNFIELGNRLGE